MINSLFARHRRRCNSRKKNSFEKWRKREEALYYAWENCRLVLLSHRPIHLQFVCVRSAAAPGRSLRAAARRSTVAEWIESEMIPRQSCLSAAEPSLAASIWVKMPEMLCDCGFESQNYNFRHPIEAQSETERNHLRLRLRCSIGSVFGGKLKITEEENSPASAMIIRTWPGAPSGKRKIKRNPGLVGRESLAELASDSNRAN